jgi:hypothetical protein
MISYLSMIDTLTKLSDCGMLSSGAGLGVARYLLDMVKYNQKAIARINTGETRC